ncbi:MAG: hypothetical protein KHZ54_11840 [Erysipelotrichaceae bacterium]|nr:hypothetical protein [Erysipelotrichaceae bacterium]MBS5371493.1 hypothetical protein [Coprobacillus cateniformis]
MNIDNNNNVSININNSIILKKAINKIALAFGIKKLLITITVTQNSSTTNAIKNKRSRAL